MFVAWQRRSLSERGALREHDDCAHPRAGLGREKLTPAVRRTFRRDGKVRSELLWRPARGIRTCCIEDLADPVARVRFWRAFDKRRADVLEAVRRRLKSPAGPRREVAELYVKRLDWLRAELARVVPVPTVDEAELVEAMPWPMFGEVVRPEDIASERAECLAAAVRRRARWRAARAPGEPYLKWATRDVYEAVEAERVAQQRAEAHGAPPPPGTRMNIGDAVLALGLTWPCAADEAKAAYRRVARSTHPDRGGQADAFRLATEAYEEIKLRLGVL